MRDRTQNVIAAFGLACTTVSIALAIVACSLPDGGDYKTAGVGNQAQAALQKCKEDRHEPCGWVRACPNVPRENEIGALEQCVLWPDRIGPYPVGLDRAFASLYGDCELSWHERFAGTPLCRYQCPSAMGCNAFDGCFCLDPLTGSPVRAHDATGAVTFDGFQ